MVRLDDRLAHIKKMLVDRRKYFVINRGRQYGKTTTLRALEDYLKEDYIVLSLDFQLMGTEDFSDEAAFSRSFTWHILRALQNMGIDDRESLTAPLLKMQSELPICGLKELFTDLSDMCVAAPRPVMLMIDEVDSASNNQFNKNKETGIHEMKLGDRTIIEAVV